MLIPLCSYSSVTGRTITEQDVVSYLQNNEEKSLKCDLLATSFLVQHRMWLAFITTRIQGSLFSPLRGKAVVYESNKIKQILRAAFLEESFGYECSVTVTEQFFKQRKLNST